jgi:hypothetical protein
MNTIEPLFVSMLYVNANPQTEGMRFSTPTILENISRTGGESFIEDTIKLTKLGLVHLSGQISGECCDHPTRDIDKNRFSRHLKLRIPTIPSDLIGKIKRQRILLLVNKNKEYAEHSMHDLRNVVIVTMGMRLAELKRLSWLKLFPNKTIIDFLNKPGIPEPIFELSMKIENRKWGEEIISGCLRRQDLGKDERTFLEKFCNFQYLHEQIVYFANEAITWQIVSKALVSNINVNKIDFVVTGHGLLIREKLIQIAFQSQQIPVLSVMHSGIDDPCLFTSEHCADGVLGIGKIDEQIARDQHRKPINFFSINETDHDVIPVIREIGNESIVIIFLSPGQTGTAYIRCGPLESANALELLFEEICKNSKIQFALRFHPNYMDQQLIAWVEQNKPKNSFVLKGSIEEALIAHDVIFAFSLQVITAALVDVADAGIPVRHILQGVEIPLGVRPNVDAILLDDLGNLSSIFKLEKWSAQVGCADEPTKSFLQNVYTGVFEGVPKMFNTLGGMRHDYETLRQNEMNTELGFIFWVRSFFFKSHSRRHWAKRPDMKSILRLSIKFRRFLLVTLFQSLIYRWHSSN